MNTVFKEVTKERIEKLDDTSELCWFCCHVGDAGACGAAPCMPHQREDKKRGYFEVAPIEDNSNQVGTEKRGT